MKRLAAVLLVCAVLTTSLTGCGQAATRAAAEPDGRLSVVATIFAPYDFARAIAGDSADVTLLLPPGSDIHSFEPTARDIIKIQSCDVFILVGGESDSWARELLSSMDTGNMRIVTLMDCVEVSEEVITEGMETEHEHAHAGGHEPEYDEHVWTSPKNAKLILEKISGAMSLADPGSAELFGRNTAEYSKKLDALDREFQSAVDGGVRKTIVFGDRFPFLYLAQAYGLEYYAAFPGCSDESEPSARTIAFLIDKVNFESIPVVFHIELSSEKTADTICESTGAKKLLLHSCHNITSDDFKNGVTYLDLMAQNVTALKEALR